MAYQPSFKPWEGKSLCEGTNNSGEPCSNKEIDGLGFCFWHVPGDMLEEAEEITGFRRCRHASGCRELAVKGTDPPACKGHGANLGSNTSKAAAKNVIEEQALRRLEEIMKDDAESAKILNPEPIGNPLTALLDLAAEIRALREILRDRVFRIKPDEWRYKGREGEMTRAEILLYERAQEREAHILIQIAKLRIDERLAAISERRISAIERALDVALRSSGLDLAQQAEARKVLRRELTKAS
jgi:hypothetical protein